MKPLVTLFALSSPVLLAAGPEVGQPAPAFAVADVQGRPVSLAALRGRAVVLEWTNPGCPFVQRHYRSGAMPALQRQARELGAVWITVNSTCKGHENYVEPRALLQAYEAWKAAPAHLVADPEGRLGRAYEARTTPHVFVIDATGLLRYMGAVDDDPRGTRGERTAFVLEALKALRAGRSPVITSSKPYGCSVKYGS